MYMLFEVVLHRILLRGKIDKNFNVNTKSKNHKTT